MFAEHAPLIDADIDHLVTLLESMEARPVSDEHLDEARRTSHRLTGSLGLLGLTAAADLLALVQNRLHHLPSTIDRSLLEEVRSIRPLLERPRSTKSSTASLEAEG